MHTLKFSFIYFPDSRKKRNAFILASTFYSLILSTSTTAITSLFLHYCFFSLPPKLHVPFYCSHSHYFYFFGWISPLSLHLPPLLFPWKNTLLVRLLALPAVNIQGEEKNFSRKTPGERNAFSLPLMHPPPPPSK